MVGKTIAIVLRREATMATFTEIEPCYSVSSTAVVVVLVGINTGWLQLQQLTARSHPADDCQHQALTDQWPHQPVKPERASPSQWRNEGGGAKGQLLLTQQTRGAKHPYQKHYFHE